MRWRSLCELLPCPGICPGVPACFSATRLESDWQKSGIWLVSHVWAVMHCRQRT